MEENKFSKFQKAPYLDLDDYKAPHGIKAYFVPMDDGIRIRVCHWMNTSTKSKGTILLQQGHNEFIEKYFETIQEFLDNFPYSKYKEDSYQLIQKLRNRIAKKNFEAGRLYLKMKNFKSAFFYFDIILSEFYDTKF